MTKRSPTHLRPLRQRVAPIAIILVAGFVAVQADADPTPKGAPSTPAASTSIIAATGGGGLGKLGGGHVLPKPAPRAPIPEATGPAPKPEDLWVGGTSDALLLQLEHRAIRDAIAGGRGAIGAVVAIPQLADDASAGLARASLDRIAEALARPEVSATGHQVGQEAAVLSRAIAPDAGTQAGHDADAGIGLVSAWRLVGPFKDSSGTGLDRAEGPEIAAPAVSGKGDAKAARPLSIALFREAPEGWSDGAFEAAWRAVPAPLISARGVPLDVLVYPRRETCTYLASAVTLAKAGPIVVHVASSGSVRALFDGATIARSDDQNAYALADRFAARIETTAGAHLLALKVCAGPSADSGRVRARITDEAGHAIDATFSDDLTKLPSTLTPPTNVTRVTTPLERALLVGEREVAAVEAKGDAKSEGTTDATAKLSPRVPSSVVDETIGAALVRRLGGADDLRSPKVQGLLDLVVNASPRPDILAIAGFLAPNRGSETAWLGLGLARSRGAAGYEPVAQFALRALASARLDAGYVDWAASTIAGSELRTATDLDAQEARARLLFALGQRDRAYEGFKAIWDAKGPQTPTSVLRTLGTGGFGRPLIAAAALDQSAKEWPRQSAVALADSKRIVGEVAVKAAVIDSFRYASTADDVLALADLLDRSGLPVEHRRLLGLLTEWAPNRKEVWSNLAQALASSTEAKERSLIVPALQRARELDPGSPFLRAEQAALRGESHFDDESFIPSKESFRARRKGVPAAPAGSPPGTEPLLSEYDRQLNWLRVVTVDDAGRVITLFHYTREIVQAPKDATDLEEDHIPSEGDVVEVVRARVHRADGTTALPQEISEGDGLRIRWSDLKPGDVVEVATRGYSELPIGDRGAAPYFFLDYAGGPTTHPVLYNEVVVRSPKRHPLYTSLIHGEVGMPDIHTTTEDKAGRTVERYVWQKPVILPEEPLQPHGTEIFPTIIGSQFKSWDDFVTWYKAGIVAFESVDPRVKRKAEEIVKGKKTREDRLHAIFNWVADEVKYVNYVSAEQWLPNRPQNVLDRMQGDCDDKAMLLMTMLKAIGIDDAQEVLVQTRYTGQPSLITAKGAVAPLFDHGIAFLPGKFGQPDRYLDATSPESRIGPLPSMDARAPAIRIVREGATPIVTLPSSSPSEHGIEGTWTFALHDDGAADIGIDEAHVGDSAFFLRMSLKQAASAATWLEKFHDVATLPQIEVLPPIEFQGELPQGRAHLKFKAKSASFARREGTDLVVGVRWGAALTPTLAPLVKRVTPVVLPPNYAPNEHVITGVVTPPPGYHVGELTAGGDVDGGAYGKATLTIEKGPGGSVVVKRSLILDQSTIAVAEYGAWRDFLLRVDALFRREIRFVKGGV